MGASASMVFQVDQLDTPTGRMLIVCDDMQRLRAVDWEDHEQRLLCLLQRHYGPVALRTARPGQRVCNGCLALSAYFDGALDAIDDVDTTTNGTVFQRQVWAALRRIPAGATLSYSALAARIGRPAAVRAVGAANGANPIAIIVPCHRVIGADAALTGYGGGLARKRWLLAHERSRARAQRRPASSGAL